MRRIPAAFIALTAGSALLLACCQNPFVQKIAAIKALAASPVMGLSAQGGAAIANGGSFAYGELSITETKDQSFVITNSGKSALSIPAASVAITGTDSSCFAVASALPVSIPPGGSASFSIRFAPGSVGAKSASLVFATNDVSNANCAVGLSGTGISQTAKPAFSGGNDQRFPNLASGGIVSVAISCATEGAKIYYTTNNSTPSLDSLGVSTFLYTAAFPYVVPDTGTGVLKALAKADGLRDSELTTAFFSKQLIDPPVITPSIEFTGYYYPSDTPLKFTIQSQASNAIILFTIDGASTPAYAGSVNAASGVSAAGLSYYLTNGGTFTYAGPHTGAQLVINAIGYLLGSPPSSSAMTTSTTYRFKMSPPAWASVQPSTTYYASDQSVTLSCVNGNGGTASITYSTSGSTVDPPGPNYSGAITVPAGAAGSSTEVTIQAIAHQSDWIDSEPLPGTFRICGPGVWIDGSNNSKWDQATWQ